MDTRPSSIVNVTVASMHPYLKSVNLYLNSIKHFITKTNPLSRL